MAEDQNVDCSGTLFTFTKPWHDNVSAYENLGFAESGDTILLIQDAVLALHSKITLASFLAKCESHGVQVAALTEDCQLRGIQPQVKLVTMVDYAGFVDLACKYERQVSW